MSARDEPAAEAAVAAIKDARRAGERVDGAMRAGARAAAAVYAAGAPIDAAASELLRDLVHDAVGRDEASPAGRFRGRTRRRGGP